MTTVPLDERVQCVVRSEVNQRPNNEDSVQVLSLPGQGMNGPLYLLSIADGMGGHAHGEDVSQEGLRKISGTLLEELLIRPSINPKGPLPPRTTAQIEAAVYSAITQANTFLKRMISSNNWGVAGATLVLALVSHDRAWVSNLGDSPLYHWQGTTGELRQITEDHTVTNALLKGGQISPEVAEHHSYKNVLELYLGCDELPDPLPFYEIPLAVGDRLLLCSDGVNGDLSDETIGSILENQAPLEEIAEQLIQAARAADSKDNQTLVLWQHPVHTRHDAETIREAHQGLSSNRTLMQPS
ncbi:PP2C family protein-serine/threonine phosphatase [Lyngbya confervoides]|uniref:Protein phosphatase 2C domain-containing protein n=1 Tax=Lyngbya confervoides BDU141951 TaxID=1574623 RepID=A0ABD4T1K4_9CYAN|nr:protein phosphatase 2C domain-containing protein [Lyngbya confervoides]MCM1982399.1 protein phosphatase 2C domain-containing protein [Lyngbya confervoides BDU141951]